MDPGGDLRVHRGPAAGARLPAGQGDRPSPTGPTARPRDRRGPAAAARTRPAAPTARTRDRAAPTAWTRRAAPIGRTGHERRRPGLRRGWRLVRALPAPVAAGLFRAAADRAHRRGGPGTAAAARATCARWSARTCPRASSTTWSATGCARTPGTGWRRSGCRRGPASRSATASTWSAATCSARTSRPGTGCDRRAAARRQLGRRRRVGRRARLADHHRRRAAQAGGASTSGSSRSAERSAWRSSR